MNSSELDKKSGLSMSASSKDLSTILSKSNVLPSSSMLYDKNNFDNNSMVVSQNLKMNNFVKEPSNHSKLLKEYSPKFFSQCWIISYIWT